MFSITTTALSTNIPIPNANPPIEIIFKVIPDINISKKAAMTDIGIASPTMIVGFKSLKNTSRTPIASKPPIKRFWKTELIEFSINSPWLTRTSNCAFSKSIIVWSFFKILFVTSVISTSDCFRNCTWIPCCPFTLEYELTPWLTNFIDVDNSCNVITSFSKKVIGSSLTSFKLSGDDDKYSSLITPSSTAAPTNPDSFCWLIMERTKSSLNPYSSNEFKSKSTSRTISASPIVWTSDTPVTLSSSGKISLLSHSVFNTNASSSDMLLSYDLNIVTVITGSKSGLILKIFGLSTFSGKFILSIISLNSTETLSRFVPSWKVINDIAKFSLDCEETLEKLVTVETAASRGLVTSRSISSGLAPI